MGYLLVIFLILFKLTFGFLITAGSVYLITLCFGLTFSWKIACGIWLILEVLSGVFGGRK